MTPKGAYVMGRNMFGPDPRRLVPGLAGLVDEEPPYHAPVFVLTHYPRDPIEMKGGTTFHFVTDGFDAAFSQAQAAADGGGVDIACGASPCTPGAGRRGHRRAGTWTWPRCCSAGANGSSTAPRIPASR